MRRIGAAGVGVNVHYVPMPMLTLFERLGYDRKNHPKAFAIYQNEITLPVYNGLTEESVNRVVESVVGAMAAV